MKSGIPDLIETITARKSHVVVVSGNIYDTVICGEQTFSDLAGFLESLTAKRFPQLLRYDIFSGISVVRGYEDVIAAAMGISDSSNPGDTVLNAVRQMGIVRESHFPVNPPEVFLCLDRLFSGDTEPLALIVDCADSVIPGNAAMQPNRREEKALVIALTRWARDHSIREKGHLIVLLCRSAEGLDRELLDRIHETSNIRIPKPDLGSRKQFFLDSGMEPSRIIPMSAATSGLAFKELAGMKELGVEEIFSRKRKILSDEYGDLLEVMETTHDFQSIGGLEKQIVKLQKIASAVREGRTTLVPQGILFVGPPGTGKTLLAEALATEAKLNFVRPRDIKNAFVGKSEERMTLFLAALKDLAPVVCFVDEADQNQAQRGSFDGDSGVSKNLFKKMLECMSDSSLRGKVLWVLATNRPDLMDPAMKRPGRCDLRIPFLPADARQLALICKAAFHQFPEMKSKIKDWLPFAKRSAGYTGADMIEIMRRAWERANECGRDEILPEDMDWSLADYKPQIYDRAETLRMSLLAIIECSSKSLLPDDWEERGRKYYEELSGVPSKRSGTSVIKDFSSIFRIPESLN